MLAALLLSGLRPAAAQPLPATVEAALRAAAVAPDEVGIAVLPLAGGKPLLMHRAQQAYHPASTMKLVSTYAALSLLGPDYRWTTAFVRRGSLQGEVLEGDLILRGGGDPKFVVEDMTALVGRLRETGLREIRGQLVIDDALYAVGDSAYERFDGVPGQPYNVRPFAALMNFKATRVSVRPLAQGLEIRLDPPLAGVPIQNRIQRIEGPCREGVQGLIVEEEGPEESPSLRVSGRYSAGCAEQSMMVAVLNHRQFIEAFFRAAWQAAGGEWTGRAVIERSTDPTLPALATWTSPRNLAEVVRDVNKFSNNVMARQVMLQSSVDPSRRMSGSLERARAAVLRWLERRGLRSPELVLDNGSGLSRIERIAPESMARLLLDAAASEQGPAFIDSLPIAGVDGTMKSRLRGEPITGRAWIKTGSLVDVRSIAGYVEAASGRRYAVVMLVNGPRAPASGQAQDALLRWVYAQG